jgi:hypothetical protein
MVSPREGMKGAQAEPRGTLEMIRVDQDIRHGRIPSQVAKEIRVASRLTSSASANLLTICVRGRDRHQWPEELGRRANRPLRELTVINVAPCAPTQNKNGRASIA